MPLQAEREGKVYRQPTHNFGIRRGFCGQHNVPAILPTMPIVQEDGWAAGTVGTGADSHHEDSNPGPSSL